MNKILDHKDVQANSPVGIASGVILTIPQFVAARWKAFMLTTKIPWPHPERDLSDVYVEAEIVADRLPGRLGECGRWIARCITKSCYGAEDVDFDSKLFMCCSCFNSYNDYKWLKVKEPKNRKQIEHILLLRPAKNRWWKSGETLKQLRAENIKHGYPDK